MHKDHRQHANPLIADLTKDIIKLINTHARRIAGTDVCADQTDEVIVATTLAQAYNEAIVYWMDNCIEDLAKDLKAKAMQENARLGGKTINPSATWRPVQEVINDQPQRRPDTATITINVAVLSSDGKTIQPSPLVITGHKDAVASLIDVAATSLGEMAEEQFKQNEEIREV